MNETSIATLVAWGVISVFGIGFLIWLTKEEERDDLGGYDERQMLARGKANSAALTAGIGYLFLLQFANLWEAFPLSIQEVSAIGILVMLLTYASVAIWKDAYVRVREKEGSAIGWAVFLGISLLIGWNDWIELAMSICCFYTAGLIALRRFLRKREEREETDG